RGPAGAPVQARRGSTATMIQAWARALSRVGAPSYAGFVHVPWAAVQGEGSRQRCLASIVAPVECAAWASCSATVAMSLDCRAPTMVGSRLDAPSVTQVPWTPPTTLRRLRRLLPCSAGYDAARRSPPPAAPPVPPPPGSPGCATADPPAARELAAFAGHLSRS